MTQEGGRRRRLPYRCFEAMSRAGKLGEQFGTGWRDLHVGATLVHPESAALDRKLEAATELGRLFLILEKKRLVDLLDVDAAGSTAWASSISRRAAFSGSA